MPQLGYHSNGYAPQTNAQYYDPHPQNHPHVQSLHSYNYSPQLQSAMSSSYPPNPWVNMDAPTHSQYAQWAPSSLPNGTPVSSMRSSSYATQANGPQPHWPSQQPSYLDTGSPVSPVGPSAPSPSIPYPSSTPVSAPPEHEEPPPPSPPNDLVPAPRSGRRNNREQYSNGGRTSGNPPVGVTKCASCKVTHSPEWRKGPSGKKDLCNA